MEIHLTSYYIGIAIVFISHIYLLSLQRGLTKQEVTGHSIVNLLAAFFVAYYFANKEGIIKF